ncbi:GntP family permease, partial [Escherichia coli]|nr:GntP family permease [Escherichia coli]
CFFIWWILVWSGASHHLKLPALAAPITTDVAKISAFWAVESALIAGILLVVIFGYRNIHGRLAEGSRTAVGGAILAALNTASE